VGVSYHYRREKIENGEHAMKARITPSQKAQQAMQDLLSQGYVQDELPASQFLKLAAQMVVQQVLEQEVTDYLGWERYERQPETSGYRNGYKPGRIRSAEGELRVEVPQVRDTSAAYQSRLTSFLRGNSDVLDYLVTQMYPRGLSTRAIEDSFRNPQTGETLLRRTAVSEITKSLWQEYQACRERDLSGFEVEYVFLDAIYESLREQGGLKEALLWAWGICRDGRKILLHLDLGNKESLAAWREFCRDLVKRGLPIPTMITTDGGPAVVAAVEEIWAKSLRQRCTVHKTRNILDKVPQSAQPAVKRAVNAIWEAPTRATADTLVKDFLERYGQLYPAAAACLQDDLEACLSFLRCPGHHHKRIPTTNLIERAFLEERRRTNSIPRFWDEKSCLKLAYATLWQASQRWQKVHMSEVEVAMLRQLRRELGIDPLPPQPLVKEELRKVS
jgi:transposase-like protein